MAFIIDQTVINIKLTNKGRQLLSTGQLTFKKFAVGDSEIDYSFYDETGYSPSGTTIFRPKDNNPQIVSYITKINDGSTLNDLGTVVSDTTIITNTASERGFFSGSVGSASLYNDVNHIKQADGQIAISGVTGGTSLIITQAPTYGSNLFEPEDGDYLLVRWTNPDMTGSTTGFTVSQNIPYLWYKISGVTGSLASNNLQFEVDRELPNFNGSGGTIQAGALFYPNNNNRAVSGTSIDNYYGAPYITDFVSESVLAFIDNFDTPTIDVPVWNMSIVFTEQIAGVSSSGRTLSQYYTAEYAGFVQYIEKLEPTVKNIGIIHYTNNSPSNIYGEGFYVDTPVLKLPSIMWHKSTGGTIGLTLSADTASKSDLPELNTRYYDLVDEYGNAVGKVFNDLKIFVIEDQELLYAMTYKSNRNWTLPTVTAGFNSSLCPDSDIEITDVQIV